MAAESSFIDHEIFIQSPAFHVDLSGLDARHPVHYSDRLFIFSCVSPAQRDVQLAALKLGLQSLVLRCPVLGGNIDSPQPDETEDGQPNPCTIVPGPGLELIVKDLSTSVQSFAEMEAAEFLPLLLPSELLTPIPQDLGNRRPFAACKVQFSAIRGGTIITFAMSHSVADGVGTNELMRVLSEEVRLASEGSADVGRNKVHSIANMGLDRSAILNLKSEMPFKIEDHPAYTWKNSSPAKAPSEKPSTHPFKAALPETPVLLRISASNLAQLKADATLPGAPMISTHDAISALIWRSVLLIRSRRSEAARNLPESTISNIFMPSDARRHLNLPQSYVGNAVYQLAAALDIGTLLSPSGLQHAASAVRGAITAVNPALVSSILAMTNEKWIDWQFEKTYDTTGVAMGTDWTSGSVYRDDWGKLFGTMARYRYPGWASNCVLPKRPNGSAELVVAVMPDEIDCLKSLECFGKYLDELELYALTAQQAAKRYNMYHGFVTLVGSLTQV